MTEQEAKTKICPQGAMRASFDGNWDRGYCIGSACMAWRQSGWRDKQDGQIKSMAYEKADPEHWEPMFYCGLAGKP